MSRLQSHPQFYSIIVRRRRRISFLAILSLFFVFYPSPSFCSSPSAHTTTPAPSIQCTDVCSSFDNNQQNCLSSCKPCGYNQLSGECALLALVQPSWGCSSYLVPNESIIVGQNAVPPACSAVMQCGATEGAIFILNCILMGINVFYLFFKIFLCLKYEERKDLPTYLKGAVLYNVSNCVMFAVDSGLLYTYHACEVARGLFVVHLFLFFSSGVFIIIYPPIRRHLDALAAAAAQKRAIQRALGALPLIHEYVTSELGIVMLIAEYDGGINSKQVQQFIDMVRPLSGIVVIRNLFEGKTHSSSNDKESNSNPDDATPLRPFRLPSNDPNVNELDTARQHEVSLSLNRRREDSSEDSQSGEAGRLTGVVREIDENGQRIEISVSQKFPAGNVASSFI